MISYNMLGLGSTVEPLQVFTTLSIISDIRVKKVIPARMADIRFIIASVSGLPPSVIIVNIYFIPCEHFPWRPLDAATPISPPEAIWSGSWANSSITPTLCLLFMFCTRYLKCVTLKSVRN